VINRHHLHPKAFDDMNKAIKEKQEEVGRIKAKVNRLRRKLGLDECP